MNKFTFTLLALFLTACQNSNITKIQEGFLDFDKSVSIGYVLNAYKDCKNLTWSFETQKGKDFVSAKCDITDITKEALEKDEQRLKSKNHLITADYIKIFKDNFEVFKNLTQNFVFIINKDGSYNLDRIEMMAHFKNGSEIVLYANNKSALMNRIYQNQTLINNTDEISFYTASAQNFFLEDKELKEKFVNFQPFEKGSKINQNSPFNLKFGGFAKDEILKIPCNFKETKFKDKIFANNGYLMIYDNCSLLNNMQKLELGFDDEKRLVFVKVKFGGLEYGVFNDIKNGAFKTEKLDSKVIVEHGIELPFSYSAYYINEEIYNRLKE